MTMRVLTLEEIKYFLIKDSESRYFMAEPFFTGQDLKLVKLAIRQRHVTLTVKDRLFLLSYFVADHTNAQSGERESQEWVTCKPVNGNFVPMFSGPVKEFLSTECYAI